MKSLKRTFAVLFILIAAMYSCQNPVGNDMNQKSVESESRSTAVAWRAGMWVSVGDLVTYNGKTYEVLMAHTTFDAWAPGPDTYAVYKEVEGGGNQPTQPYVEFDASGFSGFGYEAEGSDIVFHANMSGILYDTRDSFITTSVPSQGVKKGQTVTVSGDIENLWRPSSPIKDDFKDIRTRVKLSTGEVYYSAFNILSWSNNRTSFSLEVESVNTTGTVSSISLHFPGRFGRLKFSNLKYSVSGNESNVAAKYAFPNRLTALPKHSGPLYIINDEAAYSQTSIESDVQDMFVQWRSRYLKSANFANAEGKVGKYVAYGGGVEGTPAGMEPVTTSECHGWGMLILAHMDNEVNDTRSDFDEMIDYYLQWKSTSIDPIMDWQQSVAVETTSFDGLAYDNKGNAIKGPKVNVTKNNIYTTPKAWNGGGDDIIYGGFGGAADGDMDIAYSLLIADKQWGSNGRHDYKALALEMIAGIKKYYIATAEGSAHILIATWYQEGGNTYSQYDSYWATRSSDFLLTHFSAFKDATNDSIWDDVHDRIEGTFLDLQYDSPKGLFPDFYVRQNGSWVIPTGKVLETGNDGDYYWNAARAPWRTFLSLTHDWRRSPLTPYSIDGNAYAFNRFVSGLGGVDKLATGYTMDGQLAVSDKGHVSNIHENMAFAAPALIPSIYSYGYSTTYQNYAKENWEHVKNDANLTPATPEKPAAGYFGETIRMICSIAYSGNWINP